MTGTAGARVDFVLRWLPLAMAAAAWWLALSLRQELPRLALLMTIGAAGTSAWFLGSAADRIFRRVFVTPAGIKWDWVLLPVFAAAMIRYGLPLFGPVIGDRPKLAVWALGSIVTAMGGRMARERRLKLHSQKPTENLDWHDGVARYQVPLVLFALGLTLLQMAS